MGGLFEGLEPGSFPEIAADCPWKFLTRSAKGITSRSPDSKYSTMTLAELAALPVATYAAKHARLWFWITGPLLAVGAHVPIMRAWGFEPAAVSHVWVKPTKKAYENGALFVDDVLFKMGPGYTTRQNAEYVILGNRGKPPKRLTMKERQIIVEPAREHSRKPEKFYASVERYAAGAKLELFGRTQRNGWIVRGNEAHKFPAKLG